MYMWCIWRLLKCRTLKWNSAVMCCSDDKDNIQKYKVFSDNKEDFNKEFPIDVLQSNREKYSGCLSCPLVEVCLAKAKRADGYYSIVDTIDKFTGMDREVWDAQWECKKPGTSGLVYREFDETIHVIPEESFKFNPDYPCYAGQDFDEELAYYFTVFANGDAVIFDEIYERRKQTVLAKHYWKPNKIVTQCINWFADTENADAISQMESIVSAEPQIKI